jgi:hypothetical protein
LNKRGKRAWKADQGTGDGAKKNDKRKDTHWGLYDKKPRGSRRLWNRRSRIRARLRLKRPDTVINYE